MKTYTKPEIVIAFFEAENIMALSTITGVQNLTGVAAKEIGDF